MYPIDIMKKDNSKKKEISAKSKISYILYNLATATHSISQSTKPVICSTRREKFIF